MSFKSFKRGAASIAGVTLLKVARPVASPAWWFRPGPTDFEFGYTAYFYLGYVTVGSRGRRVAVVLAVDDLHRDGQLSGALAVMKMPKGKGPHDLHWGLATVGGRHGVRHGQFIGLLRGEAWASPVIVVSGKTTARGYATSMRKLIREAGTPRQLKRLGDYSSYTLTKLQGTDSARARR